VLRDDSGAPLGLGDTDGAVWGTYLHGIFDEDDFRRAFLDALRRRAGLEPVGRVVAPYSIDGALDRLAAVVRSSMDMTALYRVLGL
jgi:adenosylcobyric acid synthase